MSTDHTWGGADSYQNRMDIIVTSWRADFYLFTRSQRWGTMRFSFANNGQLNRPVRRGGAGVRSHPANWANYFKLMQFLSRNWVYTPNFGLKVGIFLRFTLPPPPSVEKSADGPEFYTYFIDTENITVIRTRAVRKVRRHGVFSLFLVYFSNKFHILQQCNTRVDRK